jgi:hypothetical protein
MSFRAVRSGCALLLSLFALGVTAPAYAQDAISEEAKAYFRNGVDLISGSTPNYQDAYYQFKLAYEKSGSWKVLGNLGLCSMKLERDGEAIEYYTKYLAEGGDEIDPEERQALQRDLLLIKGNAVEVTITTPEPELEVTDARSGTAAGAQNYLVTNGRQILLLRAGTHAITATKGGKTLRWDVVLSPGKPQSHTFDFSEPAPGATPPPAAAPGALPPPAAEPRQTGGTLRTVGFVTAGVGVLALGGGVVTGLMSNSKEDDARGDCREVSGRTECPESARDDFDSASSLAGVTNVLLIGGGVLTAAGVGMILFGGPKTEAPPSAARLELTPVLSPGLSGFVAAGSF